MKKRIAFTLIGTFSFIASLAFAFDWPQEDANSETFFSYFGQLRGGRIASSLVFKGDANVKSTADGDIAIIIKEHNDDFGMFESTLGNAIIIAHKDDIKTVYGNLESSSIPKAIETNATTKEGDFLGTSGNSGWQEGQSCLEFQILDTKNKTVVNPNVLMPRTGEELPLVIGELTLDDKSGVTHNLLNERNLDSGMYSLYHPRQDVAVPYKTIVSINGTTVESISYDTLYENKDKLCVKGNSYYSVQDLYPDSKRQLLSNIRLTHGHTTLTVTLVNILGQTKSITYNLEIN